MILTVILDNQLEEFIVQFHLSGTWILAKSCLLKALTNMNNFIFISLLVIGKSTD